MIVGTYVGLVTVGGFLWWYMRYDGGPRISWDSLRHFQNVRHVAASSMLFQ
jgi:hypothetical protein